MSISEAGAFLHRHHHEAPLEIDGALFLADYGIEKRADDWRCTCGTSNFTHRHACHKCGQERSIRGGGTVEEAGRILPGDEDLSPGATSFLLLQDCYETAGEAHRTHYICVDMGATAFNTMSPCTTSTCCVRGRQSVRICLHRMCLAKGSDGSIVLLALDQCF